MKSLTEQKKDLELAGYRVILNPILLERESHLGEDDDWLFSDMPGAVLLFIGKNRHWLDVEKEGEADVTFEQVDDGQILRDGFAYRFRNEFVPDAFRRAIRDGEDVLVDGMLYRCTVHRNGWFTSFLGHDDDKVVSDHGEPTYDIGTLACWADQLEEYIKTRLEELRNE